MNSVIKVLFLLVLAFAMVSCATVNTPVAATSNELGPLVGQSSGFLFFGMFGNVDAGIQKACQDGKILNISTVDFEISRRLLGIRFTCTVTGR